MWPDSNKLQGKPLISSWRPAQHWVSWWTALYAPWESVYAEPRGKYSEGLKSPRRPITAGNRSKQRKRLPRTRSSPRRTCELLRRRCAGVWHAGRGCVLPAFLAARISSRTSRPLASTPAPEETPVCNS